MSGPAPARAQALRHALSTALGRETDGLAFEPVRGGCINEAARAHLDDRAFFCKWNDRGLARQFEAEAAGLRALRDARSGLAVPAVIAHCDDAQRAFLALEWLAPGPRAPDFDERLGRGLAALHRTSDARGFGFELDGYCGATPQPNPWSARWLAFYAEHRLLHQLRLARARGLGAEHGKALERLVARLDTLLDDAPVSALIHGDLWSGNLLVAADGGPALVDPAAYFGHREAELGMMTLFGGFSDRVFDAYQEAWPLAPGWRERLDLYALYHVLNHFNLFGGHYADHAARIARRFAG